MGTRTTDPELLIVLERGSGRSLRSQLEDQLRAAVSAGALQAGSPLPSTRTFAADLGVSRRLVVEAYDQLVAEGYLSTRPGGRTVVGGEARTPERREAPRRDVAYDLLPGTPDLASFPRTAWARATTNVLRSTANDALRYPDPAGAWALRSSLAAYLRRVRGVEADPDQIVICAGVRQGLALLVNALRMDRTPAIGLEDPGIFEGKSIIEAAGGRARPLLVDEEGVQVDNLDGLDAVVLTPAHQFPTGVVLSAARRSALLHWSAQGRLLIEDDYDAEFRYDREPVPTLHSEAPNYVAYTGSVSKTLAPALRLGWIVLPSHLVSGVVRAKQLHDAGMAVLPQLTFAEMLGRGEYDRHLRRARQHNRKRRGALLAALDRYLPGVRISGAEGGIHVLATFPADVDGRTLTRAASRRGLDVALVDEFRVTPSGQSAQLVIGYGNMPETSVEPAVRLLESAFRQSRDSRNRTAE